MNDPMWGVTRDVWERLTLAGVTRSARDIDLAIQSAREALHANLGEWFDPDIDLAWEALEPHVFRFLNLTPDELKAVEK